MPPARLSDDVLRHAAQLVAASNGNVTHAAIKAGISRGTLQHQYRMAVAAGIKPDVVVVETPPTPRPTDFDAAWNVLASEIGMREDRYEGPCQRPRSDKVAVISDIHAPFHETALLAQAFADTADADTLIIAGDVGDGFGWSRFTKYQTVPYEREIAAVSDNKGNTWEEIIASASPNNSFQATIWRAKNVAAGDTTVTVTPNVSAQVKYGILRVAGCSTTAPDDQESSKTDGAGTHPHVCAADGTVIDTADDVVVVIAGVAETDRGTITATDYTLLSDGGIADNYIVLGYRTSATALSNEQGTWTPANNAGSYAASCIASFKAGAAAAPSVGQIIWIN